MSRVQFITPEYVYKYTMVEANVDPDLIVKFIYKSQDLNLQSTIGENLYTKLKNNLPNFTGQDLVLVKEYIQPMLAEWTVYHLLPFINYKLTNKAISQKNSDSSNPSTLDDVKYLRQQVRNNAEFYSERIKDFIKNNPSDFPEYYTNANSFEVKPNRSNYFSGIATKGYTYRGPNPPLSNIDPCDFCD